MRVDWCVSSWFRIKNTHSHTREGDLSLSQEKPQCADRTGRGECVRGLPRGELRRRVRDRGADSAAAMPPAAAESGLLLAAMAKNSSRHTPRAYALSRREAYAPRRGGRMRNDTARDAFRGPEIKLLMPCVT